MLLGKEASKASIAKILDVSRSALYHFIKTRRSCQTDEKGPLGTARALCCIFAASWAVP